MIAAPGSLNGPPGAADVLAQVERMTASAVFAKSPQLAAFLVFIVDAVLRGKGERLKGYTIGVEVLRRDINFDPQIDPIVRVEATRLRRAIERYYGGPGAADPVVIDLPRGGYVPRIRWRGGHAAAPAPAAKPQAPAPLVLQPGNGMPTLRIAPFVVIGTPDTRVVAPETLGSKLSEAFALFDIINIMVAAGPNNRAAPAGAPPAASSRSDYRLDCTIEYRGNQTIDLRFKLVDESDATVIWSRLFDKIPLAENNAEVEFKIILELATALIEPYGVIGAHDRARRLASGTVDPRYRCLLDAGEAFRSFDPAAHARARECLERVTAIDPTFAIGFSYLSALYSREYLAGFGARPGDAPALDRALNAARRGIELKPQSARAYHVFFLALFLRGEIEAAKIAAEKAMALNRYDVLIMSDYGGRLIFAGEVDRGMEILSRAVGFGAILPSWNHFYLFLGHYLRGELTEARFHAGQLTSETHVYGQLARALVAHSEGRAEEARHAIQAILSLQPEWKDHSRREIGKFIIAPAIADRLARDLEAAGLAEVARG